MIDESFSLCRHDRCHVSTIHEHRLDAYESLPSNASDMSNAKGLECLVKYHTAFIDGVEIIKAIKTVISFFVSIEANKMCKVF